MDSHISVIADDTQTNLQVTSAPRSLSNLMKLSWLDLLLYLLAIVFLIPLGIKLIRIAIADVAAWES